MNVLQLTCHYSPNIGGVETHLTDLVTELSRQKFKITVLTYRPLTTKAKWKTVEKQRNTVIIRIPWIAGFFYKFVHQPFIEFLYLFPGLFFITPFIIISRKIKIIHAHGVIAGTIGIFWGKLFRKKIIISTHSIYNFPQKGIYHNFITWMFRSADYVLCLSEQSKKEILRLKVSSQKISVFTYWVDQQIFHKINKAKKDLNIPEFVVFFVGRLVKEKGILVLLEASKKFSKKINLVIAGVGPLEKKVEDAAKKNLSIRFIHTISQTQLPEYYSAADILIVPSIHEEGFGRVILEALSCGLPVIAAKRGGIIEAVDESVAELIQISPNTIAKKVNYFYSHPKKVQDKSRNARTFAKKHFSKKNIDVIINAYKAI